VRHAAGDSHVRSDPGQGREVITVSGFDRRLADVTEVDNYSWDAQIRERPEVGAQTRIVARSEEFGAPALMVNHFVSNEDAAAMQSVLVGMAQDPEGVKLLKRMNLDGFIPGEAKIYESLVQMKQALGEE